MRHSRNRSKLYVIMFVVLFAVTGFILLKLIFAANSNLPGDENNDGIVNVLDLSVLLSHWNMAGQSVDLNGDGTVNILDLSILLSHWGATGPVDTSSSFIAKSGTGLTLNGQPYTFGGFNIYDANSIWGGGMKTSCGGNLGSLNSNPNGDGLDASLTELNSSGQFQVFRSWFFETLAVDSTGAINWTPFDNTLAIAAKHNMRVIATLDDEWTYCVNSGYKYLPWYQGGYKATDGDGPLSYRNYVKAVVSRYANNPTIAMWQFINEGEAKNTDGTCSESIANTAMRAWSDDIGGLIKSIDPNHLTNIGTMGGGQCGTANGDYKTLYASPSADICEFHDYNAETTALPAQLVSDMDYCGTKGLNKPLFIGETGIKPCDVGGSFQARADAFNTKLQAQLNYSDGNGGTHVVGELPWSWANSASAACDYPIGTVNGSLDPTVTMMLIYF